jgi:hypothetical protein
MSRQSTFAEGLIAPGPANEYREALMLYGQFVGDWTTETTEYGADGSKRLTRWDVRFEWVLEGRAIQDIWITPLRRAAAVPWHDSGNRYSTTVRIYDPMIDAWHIVWINPPTGTIVRQLGRRVGDEIVQTSDVDANGKITRWVYRDISANNFRWCNECSTDNGHTWHRTQEMLATRVRGQSTPA